jgi:hypothetical protein
MLLKNINYENTYTLHRKQLPQPDGTGVFTVIRQAIAGFLGWHKTGRKC